LSEFFATGRSLVLRSPTECLCLCVCVCVTEYDQVQQ
jgi:hypothetical protein